MCLGRGLAASRGAAASRRGSAALPLLLLLPLAKYLFNEGIPVTRTWAPALRGARLPAASSNARKTPETATSPSIHRHQAWRKGDGRLQRRKDPLHGGCGLLLSCGSTGAVPDREHEELLSPSIPCVSPPPSRHPSPRRPPLLSAPNRSPRRGHFDPLLNSSFPLISDQALNLLAEMLRSND